MIGRVDADGFRVVVDRDVHRPAGGGFRQLDAELGMSADPILQVAMELETKALKDSYFQDRNLYPNVDFYTGIAYRAMGIPTNMFTVLFALGRLPGWIAHWMEQKRDPTAKISRPRQLYTGPARHTFVPMDQRS